MFRWFLWSAVVVWLSFAAAAFAFDVPEQYRDGIEVVHSDSMAPMSYLGLNKEPKGFVIDYWNKWSAETGVPVVFKLMNWKDGLEYVRTNRNAVHGGLFRTDDRLDYLQFSDKIFRIDTAFFVLSGSGITGIDSVGNHVVGVLEGGASEELMRRRYPHIRLKSFPTVREEVVSFAKGQVDAVVMDVPTIMYQAGTMGATRSIVPLEVLSESYLRAGVVKGNKALLDLVVRGVERIDSDERDHILHRWFVSDSGSSSTLKFVVVLSLVGLLVALTVLFCSGRRSHRKALNDDPHA